MRDRRASPDQGTTLIEVLVSVVLLGVLVASVLGSIVTVITATSYERDRATAQMWLNSAIATLDDGGLAGCDLTSAELTEFYLEKSRSSTPPPGWGASQLTIVGAAPWWPNECSTDVEHGLHLVTIEVRSPDGRVVERTQTMLSNH